MDTRKISRGLRLEPILSTRCDQNAQALHLSFSEYVRSILRREVGLEKKNGRAR